MVLPKRTAYNVAVFLLAVFFLFSGLYNIVMRENQTNRLIINIGNMDAYSRNRGIPNPLVAAL